jgi:exonuclease SbcC
MGSGDPMIKSLALVNMQAHKETFMDFSSGMNVIAGPSDNGKTTAIRSMEWARTNRPPGETYRNWYSDVSETMATEISLFEGGSVAISREDGKTSYLLITDQEYSFKAIKTDVPQEITDTLNLSDCNVQSQHEKYYLLQDTPGEVARKLNELVGLDIIDTAYKNLDEKIRKQKGNITTLKVTRDKLEKSIEEYANLEQIGILITRIERSQGIITAKTATLNDLKKIKSAIEEIRKEKGELSATIALEGRVSSILDRISKLAVLTKRRKSLKDLSDSLQAIKQDRESDNLWLGLEVHYKSLTDRIANVNELKKKRAALADIQTKLGNIRDQKKIADTKVSTLTTKYLAMLKEMGICPICGTVINTSILTRTKDAL